MIDKLTDQALLDQIADHDPDEDCRKEAIDRFLDLAKPNKKENNDE